MSSRTTNNFVFIEQYSEENHLRKKSFAKKKDNQEKYILCNWKMHGDSQLASEYIESIQNFCLKHNYESSLKIDNICSDLNNNEFFFKCNTLIKSENNSSFHYGYSKKTISYDNNILLKNLYKNKNFEILFYKKDFFIEKFKKNKLNLVIMPPLLQIHSLSILAGVYEQVRINFSESKTEQRLLFRLSLGAQDVDALECDEGAFTGKISAKMLKNSGCEMVMIGHSECWTGQNPEIFLDQIALKIKKIWENDMTPILCIGHDILQKDDLLAKKRKIIEEIYNIFSSNIWKKTQNKFFALIEKKKNAEHETIIEKISQINKIKLKKKLILAYEPGFAIGSAHTIPDQELLHIGDFVKSKISNLKAFLYGGAVNENNFEKILHVTDGVLLGRKSLEIKNIINICDYVIKIMIFIDFFLKKVYYLI